MTATLNLNAYTPKPKMTISDWALENIQVPAKSSVRPGPISFRDMPYQREIMDICQDKRISQITVKSAAQIGKTLISVVVIAFYTLHHPLSQIVMQPSREDLKKWIQTKFEPVVEANPRLQNAYAQKRGREGVNNAVIKSFSGGDLIFGWAGSANTARGVSAPIVVCDETDAYTYLKEGHPVDLVWQRAVTFGNEKKLLQISTPTEENASWIDSAYLDGDQRQYFVVCPQCQTHHILEWDNVRWEPDAPETARMVCPNADCDAEFDDVGRIALVRYAEADGGGWKPTQPTKRHASFHVSGLYSPVRPLEEMVAFYEKKRKENKPLTTFTNTCLGLVAAKGDTVDADSLEARAETYPFQVPADVKVLTAGADVQGDRIECEVVGWASGEESYNIDYQVFHGPTDDLKSPVYQNFFKYLNSPFETDEGLFFIYALAVDSGFNTQYIYEWILKNKRKSRCQLLAIKGAGGWERPDIRFSQPKQNYQLKSPALWTLAVDKLKQLTMYRFARKTPGPGYCHFPVERVGGDYFDQLASERLVIDPKTGKLSWEQKGFGRNEAWDCRIYAYGALKIAAPDLNRPRIPTQYGYHNPSKKGKILKKNTRRPIKSAMEI